LASSPALYIVEQKPGPIIELIGPLMGLAMSRT
jgi:hypothetical protein